MKATIEQYARYTTTLKPGANGQPAMTLFGCSDGRNVVRNSLPPELMPQEGRPVLREQVLGGIHGIVVPVLGILTLSNRLPEGMGNEEVAARARTIILASRTDVREHPGCAYKAGVAATTQHVADSIKSPGTAQEFFNRAVVLGEDTVNTSVYGQFAALADITGFRARMEQLSEMEGAPSYELEAVDHAEGAVLVSAKSGQVFDVEAANAANLSAYHIGMGSLHNIVAPLVAEGMVPKPWTVDDVVGMIAVSQAATVPFLPNHPGEPQILPALA